MMHKAWSSTGEVPYCFWSSSVKFQGHTAKKIIDFDPNWAFPDCNCSFASKMAMKWCTKLEVAWERCPIDFQGHLSNFKVTQDKKLAILTRIERFRTITPVWTTHGFETMHKDCHIEEVPYCFSRSSIKFQGHAGQKITNFDPNWKFPDCNSSLTSPMALKWCTKLDVVKRRCPIVFQGHPSNFKVTQDKISPI